MSSNDSYSFLDLEDLNILRVEEILIQLEKFNVLKNSLIKQFKELEFIKEKYRISLRQIKILFSYYVVNGDWPKCKICESYHCYFYNNSLRLGCCKKHQNEIGYKNSFNLENRNLYFSLKNLYSDLELKLILDLISEKRWVKEHFLSSLRGKIKIEFLKEFIENNNLTIGQLGLLLNYYFKEKKFPECLICKKEHSNFRRKELRMFCDKKCGREYSIIHVKDTFNRKYGSSHWTKNKKMLDNYHDSYMKKNGVKCSFQLESVKNKCKESYLKNLGVENPSFSKIVKEKIVNTTMKNWGVKCSFQSEIVKEKSRKTYYEKTGYVNNMENPEVIEKILKKSRSKKQYIFPSGKIVYVQGYEPQALDYLLNIEKINEDDIAVKHKDGRPTIKYFFKDIRKTYHPDIYIKSQNRIIEVKSTWTYEKNLDLNLYKQKTCLEQGYDYSFYIMGFNGSLLEKI